MITKDEFALLYLLLTTSVVNEQGRQMRILILIQGFRRLNLGILILSLLGSHLREVQLYFVNKTQVVPLITGVLERSGLPRVYMGGELWIHSTLFFYNPLIQLGTCRRCYATSLPKICPE